MDGAMVRVTAMAKAERAGAMVVGARAGAAAAAAVARSAPRCKRRRKFRIAVPKAAMTGAVCLEACWVAKAKAETAATRAVAAVESPRTP